MAKLLIFSGIFLIILGVLVGFISKIPFLGKLPGDIYIERRNFVFYFPLATSILLSIIVSLFLWLLSKR